MFRAVGRYGGRAVTRMVGYLTALPPYRPTALLALMLTVSACTTLDRAIGKVPWFTTMRDQPNVRPFEGPLDSSGHAPKFLPPDGSVPVTGREDSLDITSDAGLRIVNALKSPTAATAASVE